MKKLLHLLPFVLLAAAFTVGAQVPEQINFQCVVRTSGGVIQANKSVTLTVSFLPAPGGTPAYTETHTTTSDNFGLVSLKLGTGTATAGSFSAINWASGTINMELSAVVDGASISLGTHSLASVPYAFVSQKAMSLDGILTTKPSRIGMGNANPEHLLHARGSTSDVGNALDAWETAIGVSNAYESGALFEFTEGNTTSQTNSGLTAVMTGSSSNGNSAIMAVANGAATSLSNRGVYAAARGGKQNYGTISQALGTADLNVGVYSLVRTGKENIGVVGSVSAAAADGTNFNTGGSFTASGAASNGRGVYAESTGATENIGAYVKATGAGVTNYGVYATAFGGTNNWAGYFGGNVQVNGTVTNSSDVRLKKDIGPIRDALQKITSLTGVSYYWNNPEQYGKGLQHGVIAQEIEKIIPSIVSPDTEGFKAVNYMALIPFLIEAIKEQQKQIEALQSDQKVQMQDFERRLSQLAAKLEGHSVNKETERTSGLK